MSSIYDLKLNTDIIHENGSTYESLLDQNKIDLFSDERFQQKKNETLQSDKKEKDIVQGLFLGYNGTEGDGFLYNELLFSQPMVIEKKQDFQTDDTQSGVIVWVGSTVLLVVFILVMARYLKQMRQREEHDET